MFDIGMLELLVIGIVALIVIGPKDLPGLFHTLGRFTARARSMAREFSRAMEDAAKESGVDEMARDLNTIARPGRSAMGSLKDAATNFENWDPLKGKPKPEAKPEMGPNTRKLSEERAEAARKIREATAKKAEERIAREKAAAEAAADGEKVAEAKPAAKKPAAKKPAAKKPTAKPRKTAAKKPSAKNIQAKSTAKKADG